MDKTRVNNMCEENGIANKILKKTRFVNDLI